MLNKSLVPALLFLLSGTAHSQDFCILPVPGGEPILDIERKQPSRIVRNPRVLPGFEGFVVNAYNRQKLLHFNGKELVEIKDDFPHIWGFADKHIYTDLNGNSYGFGSKPKGIFYLQKGEVGWQAIDAPKDYQSVRFDHGSGVVYFLMNGAWKKIRNGKVVGKANLPEHESSYISSIRTVPELSGIFALVIPKGKEASKQSKQSLWFKPEDGDWQEIHIPSRDGFRKLIDLDKSSFEITDDLVGIFRGGRRAPLFLSRKSNGMEFQSVGLAGYWRKHEDSNTWLAWIGETTQNLEKKRWLGIVKSRIEPVPPKLFLLRNGETTTEEVKDVEPYKLKNKRNITYHGTTFPYSVYGLHFLKSENGLIVFDGKEISTPDTLRYDNIGNPSLKVLNGEAFIQSSLGVFRLSPELDVKRIDNFPIAEPWGHHVDISYLKQAKQFLISDRRSGSLFTSPDMQTYAKFESKQKISKIVTVMDNTPTVLMVGEDKIYMLTQDCPVLE